MCRKICGCRSTTARKGWSCWRPIPSASRARALPIIFSTNPAWCFVSRPTANSNRRSSSSTVPPTIRRRSATCCRIWKMATRKAIRPTSICRRRPTTSWSSWSTRSSSTPIAKARPTSTSSLAPARKRPGSAFARTARSNRISRSRRATAPRCRRGSRSCAISTSPSAASRKTARSSSRNTGRSISNCGSRPSLLPAASRTS